MSRTPIHCERCQTFVAVHYAPGSYLPGVYCPDCADESEAPPSGRPDVSGIVNIANDGTVTFDPDMTVEDHGLWCTLRVPWSDGFVEVTPESSGFVGGIRFDIWEALRAARTGRQAES